MQVKTFEAVDMKQALVLVKEELGPKAVIVSSRSIRKDGGLFGLLGRKVLEVTAAIEEPRKEEPATVKGSGPPAPAPVRPSRASGKYHDLWAVRQAVDPVIDEVRALREHVMSLDDHTQEEPKELHSDLAQIRTLLSALVGLRGTGTGCGRKRSPEVILFLDGKRYR